MAAAAYHHPTAAAFSSSAVSLSTLSPPISPSLLLYPSKPSPPMSSLSLSKPQSTTTFSKSPPNPPLIHPQFDPISNDDYFNLLRLSVRYSDFELTRAVHSSILKVQEDTQLSNCLVSAYLKLGMVDYAYRVFKLISCKDVVSYTTMISGLAKANRGDEALGMFFEMRDLGIKPNEFTFVAILTACARVSGSEMGFGIHSLAVKTGYISCTFVANALMGMYSKCGGLEAVLVVFDDMPERDIASWNTVITGLVKELMYDMAFGFFRNMVKSDTFRIDHFTLSTLLVASSGCLSRLKGREVHAYVLKNGFESSLSVNNALIEFYKNCGSVENVSNLFERMKVKDVISWTGMVTAYMEFGFVDLAEVTFDKMVEKNCITFNALLSGYCRNGEGLKALRLFCEMVEDRVELSEFTLTSVITACGLIMETKISEQIHGFVLKFGFGLDECIESALLDMCTRCGKLDTAEKMFYRRLKIQNCPIMWTSMICAYYRNGEPEKAISLFYQSQLEGVFADEGTLAVALSVCGTLGFHELGEQIHSLSLKTGLSSDLGTGNSTISMYYKCGNTKNAIRVFETMLIHDVVSWNSLIASHVLHRQGDDAIRIWSKMQKEVIIKPDSVTFLFVIAAYRYTELNLVDQCRKLFLSMRTKYEIVPTSDHYAAFVGVMGYWEEFEETGEFIKKMPFEPEVSVWRALLDSCRLRLNADLGKWATKRILALDPHNAYTYTLVSNLYSASGRWHCSETVRTEMREKGFRKLPSRSWVIRQNEIHSFFSRDKSHNQSKDIYSGLDILIVECMKAGYTPDTSFVLQEVEEHQKKDFLFYHSAKLATTFGLLTTKPGKIVRVMKNILLCGDCHTFLKYVSIVTKREIHLRDSSGFHCFVNGQCSCKDYW